VDPNARPAGPSAENGICVQTRQRELELYFVNAEEANMWLQAFERAIRIAEVRQDAQACNATKIPAAGLKRVSSTSSGTETLGTASTAATSGEATPVGPLAESRCGTPQKLPAPADSTESFVAAGVDAAEGAEALERQPSKESAASVEAFHLGWEAESVEAFHSGWESCVPEEQSAGLEPPETTASLLTEGNDTTRAAGMTDHYAAVESADHGSEEAATLLPAGPAEEESAAIAIALSVAKESAGGLFYQSGDEDEDEEDDDEDDASVENAQVVRKPSWNYASQRSWED